MIVSTVSVCVCVCVLEQRDAGGRVLLQDNWTTFFKARLNCSLPGQFPFYYSELQSTFLLRKQRIVYAVFTTPPSVNTRLLLVNFGIFV